MYLITGSWLITIHCISCSPKEINRKNLTDDGSQSGEKSYLGEGVFGVCSKKLYRGIAVAVKQFKANVSISVVKHEASVLAKMDHPGNDQTPVIQRVHNIIHWTNYLTVATGADLGGGCRRCTPPLPEMTNDFLI